MARHDSELPDRLVTVLVEAPQWREIVPDIEDKLGSCAERVLAFRRALDWEVTILLAHDALLQGLNREFRDKNTPTNVLAFPAAASRGPEKHLGDIAIAFETAAREAEEQNKPFLDHALHLTVHGMLHLLGFDHESEKDAAEMEGIEERLLSELGVPNPYAIQRAGD